MIRGWVAGGAVVIAMVVLAPLGFAQSMLGQSAPGQGQGQGQRLPSGLTPLGPVQAPLGSPSLPNVQGPTVQGPAIQSEPLAPLTAPVLVAPASIPIAPVVTPPPVPAPAVQMPIIRTPTVQAPIVQAPVVQAPVVQAPIVQAPIVQTPAVSAPAPAVQVPSAPQVAVTGPGAADWMARPGVVLQGLDKVTARVTALNGKVGEAMRFGALAVVVRSCVVRPAEMAADAAAFVEVTERGAAAPLFRGWMVVSNPGLGVIEHPVYDLRLTGCRP